MRSTRTFLCKTEAVIQCRVLLPVCRLAQESMSGTKAVPHSGEERLPQTVPNIGVLSEKASTDVLRVSPLSSVPLTALAGR